MNKNSRAKQIITFCNFFNSPPPFLSYISPHLNFCIYNFQPFFRIFGILQFWMFLVSWGKNMNINYQLGKKFAFSHLFRPLLIINSPTCYLAIFLPPPGGEGTNRIIFKI